MAIRPRADSPRCGAPPHASSLKTCHRHVFFTLRPSQGSNLSERKKQGLPKGNPCFFGPPRGIRTPDLQNRNLTLYPAALWAEMRFPYYSAAWGLCQDFRERRTSLRREKVPRAVQDAGGCFLRGAEERGRERWEAAAFSGFLRETGERDASKGRATCARKTLKAPGALRTAPGTAAPAAAARTGKCIPTQTQ